MDVWNRFGLIRQADQKYWTPHGLLIHGNPQKVLGLEEYEIEAYILSSQALDKWDISGVKGPRSRVGASPGVPSTATGRDKAAKPYVTQGGFL